MTAVIEDLDTESIIWPDPCFAGEKCLSNLQEPAVWLWSHLGGNPGCAQVFCERCDTALRVYLELAVNVNGGFYDCKHCGRTAFPRKDLVRRHL